MVMQSLLIHVAGTDRDCYRLKFPNDLSCLDIIGIMILRADKPCRTQKMIDLRIAGYGYEKSG